MIYHRSKVIIKSSTKKSASKNPMSFMERKPCDSTRLNAIHLVKLARDLTRPISPKWWWKMGPLNSGKPRLVKYYSIWPGIHPIRNLSTGSLWGCYAPGRGVKTIHADNPRRWRYPVWEEEWFSVERDVFLGWSSKGIQKKQGENVEASEDDGIFSWKDVE